MHHPPTCITTSSVSLTLHLPPSQTQVRIKLASTQEALSVAQTQDVTTRRRVAELDSALKSSAERVDVLEQDAKACRAIVREACVELKIQAPFLSSEKLSARLAGYAGETTTQIMASREERAELKKAMSAALVEMGVEVDEAASSALYLLGLLLEEMAASRALALQAADAIAERDELREAMRALTEEHEQLQAEHARCESARAAAVEQARMLKEALAKMDAAHREYKAEAERKMIAAEEARAALQAALEEAERVAQGANAAIAKLEKEVMPPPRPPCFPPATLPDYQAHEPLPPPRCARCCFGYCAPASAASCTSSEPRIHMHTPCLPAASPPAADRPLSGYSL